MENDPNWPVIESRTEYETGWYTGGYDLVEQPDGSTKRYYWADLPNSVVVVPVIDEQIVFVNQYRPTIQSTQLELPAGIIEPGESATDAAARELREETGFEASGLSRLQAVWVATGVMRHKRTIVFAEGLTPTSPDPDENEFLTVTTKSVDEALPIVREEPTNGMTVTALLLAQEDGLL